VGPIAVERGYFRCAGCGQGDFGADRVLGVDGYLTDGARRLATRAGVRQSFAPQRQAVLAQLKVDGKTNEHQAALELLKILPPRPGGYLFTGDALFCQTEVCQAITDRGDHYLLTVKDNRPGLAVDIAAGLAFAQTAATFSP
jgi:hypothetical protein